MACGHAPQARDTIYHLLAIVGRKEHAFGCHQYPRVLFKMAVGREWQPLVVHVEVCSTHEGPPSGE